VLGSLRAEILADWDIQQPAYVFECKLDSLLNGIGWKRKFEPLLRFPAVKRDIAVVVAESTDAGEMIAAIHEEGGEFLQKVDVFDVFSGRRLGEGKKSVAFSLVFYSRARTLTDKDLEARVDTIIQTLSQRFSARLRD
jgi:phenylalanyl-tRNA synthetase beta chain